MALPRLRVRPQGLTPRQERFVDAYVATLSATKAAKLAGYSESSARQIGSNLLRTNPELLRKVNQRRAELSVAAGITPERVVMELLTTARFAERANQLAVVARCWELVGRYIGMFPQESRQRFARASSAQGPVDKSGQTTPSHPTREPSTSPLVAEVPPPAPNYAQVDSRLTEWLNEGVPDGVPVLDALVETSETRWLIQSDAGAAGAGRA